MSVDITTENDLDLLQNRNDNGLIVRLLTLDRLSIAPNCFDLLARKVYRFN